MTQTFERLDVPPAYQLVFQAIETEIVEGRLNAGDRLPTETAMARQFGVNRSTVREGIRLLEQSGLVRREAGRRLHVSLPHTRELAPRVSRAMIMQRVTFRELWEVAMALEPAAAALAAVRITDSALTRLEENVEATRQAVAAGDPVVPLDVEFHALIAEAAGNKALLLCREPMSLLFYPAIRVLFTKSETGRIAQGRLIKAHEILLDALRGRDEVTARDWMTRHIVDFKRGYAVRGLDMDAAVDRLSLLAV
ncbi:FadR/GntR family transcriptional regulator [Caenispirillum salinarum]|uniref:FadR/GntR family transcriptional regulator n=1 Tax=Caenispirillum salinarum TaxID=859058 RepID=UPI0038513847